MFGGKELDIVSEYKYLGVIVDEHLSFAQCSKTLSESGGRALSAIISKLKQFKDVGFNTFSQMFSSGVTPILTYASGIWGYAKYNDSESIQNRASRYFLGVHKFTPIPALQGEMGWTPVRLRKNICILRFWNRMIEMSNDRLSKRIFNADYTKNNGWCSEVKPIFESIDMSTIYENQHTCDLSQVEEKLFANFQNEWMNSLSSQLTAI